jgi:hypothetical protein
MFTTGSSKVEDGGRDSSAELARADGHAILQEATEGSDVLQGGLAALARAPHEAAHAAARRGDFHGVADDGVGTVRPLRRHSTLTVIGTALERRHSALVSARLPDRMQQLLAMLEGVEISVPLTAKGGAPDGEKWDGDK